MQISKIITQILQILNVLYQKGYLWHAPSDKTKLTYNILTTFAFLKGKSVNKKQTCIHFSEYMTTSIAFASKCKIRRVPIIYTLNKTQRSDLFRLHIRGNNVRKLMGLNEINKTSFRFKFSYRKKRNF